MINFHDLPSLYNEIAIDVESDVIDCLRTCSYSGGHYLERFERNLCNYLGVNHSIGVSSGTDGIMLACEALHIGLGDYVLVPNNAFMAAAFGVSRSGANPLFTDCDPDTYLMDAEHAEKILQTHHKRDKIKAILVVDLYGQTPDMEHFQELARQYKVYLLEDAAQALGSTHRGKQVGHYSDMAITSFGPTKPLGTIGQGGAILTNDTILAKRIRTIIQQGCEKQFQYVVVGGNYRLDAVKAAQLYHALKRLDTWNDRRRDIAKIYNDHFSSEQRPTQQPCTKHIYHLYEFKCQSGTERDRVERELVHQQIGYGLHYPHAISDMPMYGDLWMLETPVAFEMRDRLISLPIHPFMSEEDVLTVVGAVKSCCN
jgi:dTDP-4-amino-4,6-dideoxygalactose transaminase